MTEPAGLLYTKTHEWVRRDGDIVTIGITDHAQEELGDVALLQLPEVGRILAAEEQFGEIESIKAVSDLYSPVSGEVTASHAELNDTPEAVNNDPYGDGWMIKIRLSKESEMDGLLDAAGYQAFVEEL
ncbi:MAG TPA: glycine cleavage system protein GcvH [Capsulimonadaceae bacterium]|jgi:glycine cleavage system H protein